MKAKSKIRRGMNRMLEFDQFKLDIDAAKVKLEEMGDSL
jgi:hypothetical protein